MKIRFEPIRMNLDHDLEIVVGNGGIQINGQVAILAGLEVGDSLPASAVPIEWLIGDIKNVDGEVDLTILLPHGQFAPPERMFPSVIQIAEGKVTLPPYDNPPEPILPAEPVFEEVPEEESDAPSGD